MAISANAAMANGGEKKILFCGQYFRRHEVGVDTNGDLSIKLTKGKIGLRNGEVAEIKETAIAACKKADVKYQEWKFRDALFNLQDDMGEKRVKLDYFGIEHPIFTAIISPVFEWAREKLHLSVMQTANYLHGRN